MFSKCDRREETGFCRDVSYIVGRCASPSHEDGGGAQTRRGETHDGGAIGPSLFLRRWHGVSM